MGQYRVDLDIFAGPLDLLIYLVRKEEVDIYDIPIANITAQYIKYIELIKELDIDLAGDFLVMAASLMEIKSIMLLPRTEIDDDEEGEVLDPRSELVRQLLEYKKFKDAANLLQSSAQERTQRYTRPDAIISGLKPDSAPELDLEQIGAWDLLEAFDSMMRSVGTLQNYEHIKDDTPIDLYQIELLDRLQIEGPTSFQDIFKDKTSKLAMIGLFLAMLELVRSDLIKAEQNDSSDAIYIRALTDEPADQAVQNSIIAVLQEQEDDQPEQAPELKTESASEELPVKPAIPIQEIPAPKPKAPVDIPLDATAQNEN
jgi:segregation and condensation protein A